MPYMSPTTGKAVKAVLFDTFGSVVDWRTGVSEHVAETFRLYGIEVDAVAFADTWRSFYEPSMAPIRNGEREFVPLDQLHFENLEKALRAHDVPAEALPSEALQDLNSSWERLPAWADSVAGLAALGRSFIVGPLSNANTALLIRMAQNASLPWTVILGSDTTKAYKPTANAYLEMARLLRLAPGEVMLAAAHNYDLGAAQEAGLATAFVLRPTEFGPAQTTDLTPTGVWDVSVDSILALAAALGRK